MALSAELAGVLDLPEHHEAGLDDVLVAGQHAAFLRHLAVVGALRAVGAEAQLQLVDRGHPRQQHRLDGIGQVVMQARLGGVDPLAEAHHHALLVGPDLVDAGGQPAGDHQQGDGSQSAAAAEAAAGHHPAQLFLAAADDVFQVGARGSATAAAAGATAPRTAAAAAAAPGASAAPLRSPRHYAPLADEGLVGL
jgi:hypothetical protein